MTDTALINNFLLSTPRYLPIIFAVFFLTSTILHTYQLLHHRTFSLAFFLPPSSLILAAAFILLEVTTHFDNENGQLRFASAIQGLLTAAPPLWTWTLITSLTFHSLRTALGLSAKSAGWVLVITQVLTWTTISLMAQGCANRFNNDAKPQDRTAPKALMETGFCLQMFLCVLGVVDYAIVIYRWQGRSDARSGTGLPNVNMVPKVVGSRSETMSIEDHNTSITSTTAVADAETGTETETGTGAPSESEATAVEAALPPRPTTTTINGQGFSLTYSLMLPMALLVWLLIRNVYRTIQIFSAPGTWFWTSDGLWWGFEAVVLVVVSGGLHVWQWRGMSWGGQGCWVGRGGR